MEFVATYRDFLKAHLGAWEGFESDWKVGLPPPPSQKPHPEDATRIDLVAPQDLTVGKMPLIDAMQRRRSRRQFTEEPLTLEELSFLLWATQGVYKTFRQGFSLGTVPSGGARNTFETYLSVHRVTGLEAGLCRYLPLQHQLCLLRTDAGIAEKVGDVWKKWVAKGAVIFFWTTIAYRKEWIYPAVFTAKCIAMDSGHVLQNLYLASEAIGAGTCAAGAQCQEKLDAFLGVDGEEEFFVYGAPVGKLKPRRRVEWRGEIAEIESEGDVTRIRVNPFWDGDAFVVAFSSGDFSDYAVGDRVEVKGELVELQSAYDGWPLLRGISIEKQRKEPQA
jgi:SagB-type dehydrogenase family enzyme